MSSSLIRQDLVPMIVGYVLIMGALAIGLRLSRRQAPRPGPGTAVPARAAGQLRQAGRAGPGGAPAAGPGQQELVAGRRPGPGRLSLTARMKPGWPRLAVHYLGTALGGYLLLMAVIIAYYYGVAPVAGNFLQSAFSGCALLIGLATPVFAALSWLAERTGWRF
jgi:hypothetical protein